jgi:hypothetical protein
LQFQLNQARAGPSSVLPSSFPESCEGRAKVWSGKGIVFVQPRLHVHAGFSGIETQCSLCRFIARAATCQLTGINTA